MSTVRTRREPPQFRLVTVEQVAPVSPRLVRVTFVGPALDGFDMGLPAASVRLLLPPPDAGEVIVPEWSGNEFLYDDGTRPAIRTLTPVRFDATVPALDVEIVLHGHGPMSTWAAQAGPGHRAAISGTGRGYSIDPDAREFLLAGDESAIPAIGVLLGALPAGAAVRVLVEADAAATIALPNHPGAEVRWLPPAEGGPHGDALLDAVVSAAVGPDVRIWVAGEAAAVQRIRRHLFEERSVPRARAVVRGYWKYGRTGDGPSD